MGDSVVRIGLIGAGLIVKQRHLPGLRQIPGVEIVVVCNRREETAAAVSKTYGIPETAARWQDVVARQDLDVIWIGTTPHLHAPITIAALEAGKHVFCQARMAMNLAEARSMLTASQARPHQVTMLCPPPNAIPLGLYFQKLLREEAIGKLYHFHLRALNAGWADASAPAHWRQQKQVSGNNILTLGIYAEILGQFLGQPQSLCALGRVCIEERQGYLVRIPDYLQVIGRWPGLDGVLCFSGVAQFAPGDMLEIYGSKGTLVYDFAAGRILMGVGGQDELKPVEVPAEFTRRWTVEQDFIHAVRHGGSPEPSFQTGVRYMAVVEAVQRSTVDGGWVALDSL